MLAAALHERELWIFHGGAEALPRNPFRKSFTLHTRLECPDWYWSGISSLQRDIILQYLFNWEKNYSCISSPWEGHWLHKYALSSKWEIHEMYACFMTYFNVEFGIIVQSLKSFLKRVFFPLMRVIPAVSSMIYCTSFRRKVKKKKKKKNHNHLIYDTSSGPGKMPSCIPVLDSG